MAGMGGLGELLTAPSTNMAGLPIPQGQPQAGGGTWAAWTQDPVNRAALISFGLQAMTGGWGSPTQQLAQAFGAGAEGAGKQAGVQAQELIRQDEIDSKEADRANRLETARIGADARVDAAESRGASALQRAQILQDYKVKNMAIAAAKDTYLKYATAEANDTLGLDQRRIVAHQKAKEAYDTMNRIMGVAGAVPYSPEMLGAAEISSGNLENNTPGKGGSVPAVPRTGGAPGNAQNGPELQLGPVKMGVSPFRMGIDVTDPLRARGQLSTPKTGAEVAPETGTTAKPATTTSVLAERAKSDPALQRALTSPEGRAKLREMFPKYRAEIDKYGNP